MQLEEAVRTIREILRSETLERDATGSFGEIERHHGFPHRAGRLMVFDGKRRSVLPCPVCGVLVNTGDITIVHDDGRRVTVPYTLLHEIEAGHPVDDYQKLLEILVDA